jgi:hypothetical protein
VSIMNSYEKAREGYLHVYIRIYHPERKAMFRVTDELRQKYRMIYLVDPEASVREIFE